MEEYRRRYPQVKFEGARHGEELANYYAAADVFVFPSRTDTFGLVLLEALASGVPVAAYPVPGPLDVLEVPEGASPVGCMDEDLARAVMSALAIPPERCREHALTYSWRASAEQFLSNLRPLDQTIRPSQRCLNVARALSPAIGRKALALFDYRGKVRGFFTPGLVTVLNASDDLSRADGNRRACDTVVSGPPPCRREGRPGSPAGTSGVGVMPASIRTAGLVPCRQRR